MEGSFNQLLTSSNVLFLLLGAMYVFSMHAGFAFLEVGSVRKKSQVNALVKILTDWGFTTIMYFLIGYPIAYGISFLVPASDLLGSDQGFSLVHFFFLLTFAACIPAIISGGIAERAKYWPNVVAGIIFAALVYPFFESLVWGQNNAVLGTADGWLGSIAGNIAFHDYAGSVVVHSIGGWIALPAIIILGPRLKRYTSTIKVSNIPFLALGSWLLCIGWFGFNVMSAQDINGISGLVALNSLLAMVGGTLAALIVSKNDATFIHNGALAGLIAVCAGSDVMHPIGALVVGAVAAVIFVKLFHIETEILKIDDVLGVWPLHGVVGTWGGIACGIFGQEALGGIGGVSFLGQLIGSVIALVYAAVCGFVVYYALKKTVGIRLSEHDELRGADLAIHSIEAYPEEAL